MSKLIPSKPLAAMLTVIAMMVTACGSGASTDTTSSEADANVPSTEADANPPSTQADADAPSTEAEADPLSVVVTTTIWGDIVSNIAGGAANVEVLFPIGADAHEYALSSSQVALMQEADLVVVNGLGLEEGALDVIESIEADGANVVEIAADLEPIPFGESGHHDEHDHEEEGHDHEEEGHEDEEKTCDPEAGHDHGEEGDHDDEEHEEEGEHDEHDHAEGSCDPHVWMDPLRVAAAVELIAGELASLDSSVDWAANASAYADELRSLDDEIISKLEAVADEKRKMVTNHEAFGYFADRYGFEVVGTVIPGGTTLADPSSAELAELVEVMTDEEIDVIFAETVEPAALAEAIAAEVGESVEVVTLFTGSLGGPDSDAATYVDMLRANTDLIVDALS